MKQFKFLLLLMSLIVSTNTFSQELLDSLPTTREGFVKSEPAVINTINWLESTPMDQEVDKRKLLSAMLLAWLTNSPTVTVTFNAKIFPSSKKNPDRSFRRRYSRLLPNQWALLKTTD